MKHFTTSPSQRTFSYTFDFWPRNPKEEARQLQILLQYLNIIQSPGLKWYMVVVYLQYQIILK